MSRCIHFIYTHLHEECGPVSGGEGVVIVILGRLRLLHLPPQNISDRVMISIIHTFVIIKCYTTLHHRTASTMSFIWKPTCIALAFIYVSAFVSTCILVLYASVSPCLSHDRLLAVDGVGEGLEHRIGLQWERVHRLNRVAPIVRVPEGKPQTGTDERPRELIYVTIILHILHSLKFL